jgi:YidC/Oxa1 family membrane protein insertase
MDKNTFIGIALIAGILITFSVLNQPSKEELAKVRQQQIEMDSLASINNNPVIDSVLKEADKAKKELAELPASILENVDSTRKDSVVQAYLVSKKAGELQKKFDIFSPAASGDNTSYTLQNDKLIVTIDSKGGRITSARLKDFQSYDNYMLAKEANGGKSKGAKIIEPLQLFDGDSSYQYFELPMTSSKKIKTDELFFEPVSITENKLVLRAKTNSSDKYIDFTYGLKDGKYDVVYNVSLVGLQDDVDGNNLGFNWEMKSLSTEKLVDNEQLSSNIFFKHKGGDYDYLGERRDDNIDTEDAISWVAFKHNYFSSMIISDEGFAKGSSLFSGPILNSNKYANYYKADLDISRIINPNTSVNLSFYFGPNDYDILASYDNGMEDVINLGWGIFRWTNKWMIMPIFNFLYGFGWSMGLIILLVTIIVRLIILPLTYKNYKSSAKMKVLKPEIAEITEKYKDGDAVKKQQETMALYRKTGVNPMAGCLPMFIQMPILIAVFRFFPSTIELRQKAFLWAEDLSSYESIYQLPFEIPAYGSHVSLFTLLLCISTIFYTRMNSNQMSMPSQPGMPNMKVIMYLMPIMMLFFLNSYAAGLTFYYFCGNLLTMGLMLLVKKYMIDEDKIRAKIDENKKKPKTKSNFQKKMDDLMKQQQAKAAAKKN